MRMITANTSVIALAAITGILLLNNPKSSHSTVPRAKSEYIKSDMPLVFLVRMVFTACGRNEAVVKAAAAKPVIVIAVIIFILMTTRVKIAFK